MSFFFVIVLHSLLFLFEDSVDTTEVLKVEHVLQINGKTKGVCLLLKSNSGNVAIHRHIQDHQGHHKWSTFDGFSVLLVATG